MTVTPGFDATENGSHNQLTHGRPWNDRVDNNNRFDHNFTSHFAPASSTLETDDDQLSDDDNMDAETIPDEQQVLSPKKIVAVARCKGIWIFKVQFEHSTICTEFFNQLYIGSQPATDFAASVV